MIAEQLKKSILQAAIQGKLTKQLPEDGDARDLLKEIQKEKARLVKEGKSKREKLLSEISEDEVPFDIPENWVWCRLSDCLDVRDGTHESPKYVSVGVPLVTSKNISGGTLDFENTKLISQGDADKINARSKVNIGDILFAMIGSIGNPVIVESNREFCIKNVALFKNINNLVSMPYMLIFFKYVQDILKKQSSGGVQSFVSLNHFRNFLVPLPPLTEQNRIAVQMEVVIQRIDKLKNDETKLETLQKYFPKKMKDSILQYAIQGKLTEQLPEDGDARDLLKHIHKEKARLLKGDKIKKEKSLPVITEDEIPFDIPENWCWVRLGEVITLKSGQDMTPDKYSSSSIGIPYITGASNFINGVLNIDRWTLDPKSIADEGDLLITCKGTIGDMAFLNVKNAHIARQVMAIKPIIGIDIHYIQRFLCVYVNELKSMAKSMIPGISRDMILEAIIPFPPLSEQQRIVQRLDELLPLCDKIT